MSLRMEEVADRTQNRNFSGCPSTTFILTTRFLFLHHTSPTTKIQLTFSFPCNPKESSVIPTNIWHQMWLQTITSKNNWKHKDCPIIWHEPGMRGGQTVLIGDLSSFMEYCREYYGVYSFLTKDEEEILIRGDMKEWREERDRAVMWRRVRIKRSLPSVVVVGLSQGYLPLARSLIASLLEIPTLAQVLIYEEDDAKVKELVEECSYSLQGGVQIINSLEKTMKHTRLLLILNIPGSTNVRKPETSLHDWLCSHVFWTLKLAEKLRLSIPETCRVVVTAPTRDWPLCLNTAVFAEALADRLNPRNVVAVTADVGMEELSKVAHEFGIPSMCMLAAPVWGFLGLNKMVDVESCLMGVAWLKPNARAKKNIPNSSMSQGQWIVQLRRMLYKISGRQTCHANVKDEVPFEEKYILKLRSIMTLLRLWFSEKPSNGEIISLGLFSNGSNNLPEWLFLSQPASLGNDGIWKPSEAVSQPIGSEPIKMSHLVPLAVYWSAYFGLGIYLKAPWAAMKELPLEKQRVSFFQPLAPEIATREENVFQFSDLEYYKKKAYRTLGREMVLAEAEMIWVPKTMEGRNRQVSELEEAVQSITSFSLTSEDSIEVKYVSTQVATMD